MTKKPVPQKRLQINEERVSVSSIAAGFHPANVSRARPPDARHSDRIQSMKVLLIYT